LKWLEGLRMFEMFDGFEMFVKIVEEKKNIYEF
jgi:hypothetical protein